MKRTSLYRMLAPLAACLTMVACGGDGGDGNEVPTYVEASSTSFSPTTARDKATNAENVALRWVYVVNNGLPVNASLLDDSVSIAIDAVEVTLDPATLRRQVNIHGPVSGSSDGAPFSGSFSAVVGEDFVFSEGRTVFTNQSGEVTLMVADSTESVTAKLTAAVGAFAPPYEWLLDRDNLDQLPIGYQETVTSNGTADITITVTDEAPMVISGQAVTVSETWIVLEQLPTMVVRGTSYSNVVKLSRRTRVPDFSGNLTTVTIYYWVAKGVGMIRGEGVFRILNLDDVVYELSETNLSQL